jgi:hypothetical protein
MRVALPPTKSAAAVPRTRWLRLGNCILIRGIKEQSSLFYFEAWVFRETATSNLLQIKYKNSRWPAWPFEGSFFKAASLAVLSPTNIIVCPLFPACSLSTRVFYTVIYTHLYTRYHTSPTSPPQMHPATTRARA